MSSQPEQVEHHADVPSHVLRNVLAIATLVAAGAAAATYLPASEEGSWTGGIDADDMGVAKSKLGEKALAVILRDISGSASDTAAARATLAKLKEIPGVETISTRVVKFGDSVSEEGGPKPFRDVEFPDLVRRDSSTNLAQALQEASRVFQSMDEVDAFKLLLIDGDLVPDPDGNDKSSVAEKAEVNTLIDELKEAGVLVTALSAEQIDKKQAADIASRLSGTFGENLSSRELAAEYDRMLSKKLGRKWSVRHPELANALNNVQNHGTKAFVVLAVIFLALSARKRYQSSDAYNNKLAVREIIAAAPNTEGDELAILNSRRKLEEIVGKVTALEEKFPEFDNAIGQFPKEPEMAAVKGRINAMTKDAQSCKRHCTRTLEAKNTPTKPAKDDVKGWESYVAQIPVIKGDLDTTLRNAEAAFSTLQSQTTDTNEELEKLVTAKRTASEQLSERRSSLIDRHGAIKGLVLEPAPVSAEELGALHGKIDTLKIRLHCENIPGLTDIPDFAQFRVEVVTHQEQVEGITIPDDFNPQRIATAAYSRSLEEIEADLTRLAVNRESLIQRNQELHGLLQQINRLLDEASAQADRSFASYQEELKRSLFGDGIRSIETSDILVGERTFRQVFGQMWREGLVHQQDLRSGIHRDGSPLTDEGLATMAEALKGARIYEIPRRLLSAEDADVKITHLTYKPRQPANLSGCKDPIQANLSTMPLLNQMAGLLVDAFFQKVLNSHGFGTEGRFGVQLDYQNDQQPTIFAGGNKIQTFVPKRVSIVFPGNSRETLERLMPSASIHHVLHRAIEILVSLFSAHSGVNNDPFQVDVIDDYSFTLGAASFSQSMEGGAVSAFDRAIEIAVADSEHWQTILYGSERHHGGLPLDASPGFYQHRGAAMYRNNSRLADELKYGFSNNWGEHLWDIPRDIDTNSPQGWYRVLYATMMYFVARIGKTPNARVSCEPVEAAA